MRPSLVHGSDTTSLSPPRAKLAEYLLSFCPVAPSTGPPAFPTHGDSRTGGPDGDVSLSALMPCLGVTQALVSLSDSGCGFWMSRPLLPGAHRAGPSEHLAVSRDVLGIWLAGAGSSGLELGEAGAAPRQSLGQTRGDPGAVASRAGCPTRTDSCLCVCQVPGGLTVLTTAHGCRCATSLTMKGKDQPILEGSVSNDCLMGIRHLEAGLRA